MQSKIIKTGNLYLVQWGNGACRPATDFEVELWEQHKESVRLLQIMYDMSDKPVTDTDYLMVIGEVGRFLRSMEDNP